MKLRYVWLVKHMPEDFLSQTKQCTWRQEKVAKFQNSLKKFQSNEELVWASYASLRTAKYQFVKTLQWLWSEATKLLAGSMHQLRGKKQTERSVSKLKKMLSSLANIEDAEQNN